MDDILAARLQMALSLGFHMVFAGFGIGLPVLMALSEWLYLRRGQEHYRSLAKTWSAAAGFIFVIGALSGTALAVELGLLWPAFMARAGSTIGPAFTCEAVAFFIEAIFLGLYLYGWNLLSAWTHWATGVVVAISGMISGVLVLAANAWMQNPYATQVEADGTLVASPGALFSNPSWPVLALHSTVACYAATGFAVAGVYAWRWLHGRRDAYVRSALRIALAVGGIAALIQPIVGDICAHRAMHAQPVKFAAMEAHFTTEAQAPLIIGGLPNTRTGQVDGALALPALLSVLSYNDPQAVVVGLDQFPRDQWPNVVLCHVAFQVMIFGGLLMLGTTLAFWLAQYRQRWSRWIIITALMVSPFGFVALEAGWVVTEVGRQPWIVQGLMRTSEAATTATGSTWTCAATLLLYLILTSVLCRALVRLGRPSDPQVASAEHHAR